MAIARINGPMLNSNLERQGVNLAIDANLVYYDVTSRFVGINTTTPAYPLDVTGNAHLGNLYVQGNTITTDSGYKLNLGTISNITINGGSNNYITITDGAGNLSFVDANTLPAVASINANILASNVAWQANAAYQAGQIAGANTAIVTANTAVVNYVNTLNSAMASNVAGSNAAIVTANTAVVNYVNTLNSAMASNVAGANIAWQANAANQEVEISTINANLVAINLAIANINSNVTSVQGNTITLGANTVQALTSNAVNLTQTTKITDAIASLNNVLGKLVPPAPPSFPAGTALTINSVTIYGRMTTMTQVDNTGSGRSVPAGTTLANVLRTGSYTTNTFSNMGDGSIGVLTVYLDNLAAGANTLVAGGGAKTTSNLVITNNQDYHNVSSTVAAGFWYSFSCYASGTITSGGYHGANIAYTGGSGTNTTTATWYYDSSAPGTPTFSNVQALSSGNLLVNAVSYSSTIPHFNSGTSFKLKGNIAKLSGDMYYSSDTFITGTAGGAFQAPTGITYTQAGVTTPLAQNLYVSSGSAYYETNVSILASGFGSSSTGPSLIAYNSYNSGTQTYTPTGLTILYKNGTSTNIEETSIPVTSVGTGSGNGLRIVNPGSTDNPSFTGSEAAFNSQTSTLQTYDATNIGSGTQGIIKFDQTNYSTGYLPAGPNLSTQGSNQYFTFKFTRTTVSKFDVLYSGTIAGLWVALPGSTIMTTASTTNGWLDMSTAYAGSGVPGSGAGGNGSAGCSVSGTATLNSLVSNKSVTATFGTAQSGSSGTNDGTIYVRIKLTSGQSLTALSIVTATH